MEIAEWTKQLEALRDGKLRLEGPEESGLTCYASTALYELRQYVAALEHGYRALSAILERYRAAEKNGKKLGLRDLEEENGALRVKAEALEANQWSDGACLGYVAMSAALCGFPDRTVFYLTEAAKEAFGEMTPEEAAEYYQGWADNQAANIPMWNESQSVDGSLIDCVNQKTVPVIDGGDGGTSDARSDQGIAPYDRGDGGRTYSPEWIGPGAELKTEVAGC